MNLHPLWRLARRRAWIAALLAALGPLLLSCAASYKGSAPPPESRDVGSESFGEGFSSRSAEDLQSSALRLRESSERTRLGDTSSTAGADAAPASATEGQLERRLVHTGALALAVPDAISARAQLAELATTLGGYVQSERDAAIVLRIPSARFREGLESAAKVGREISRRIDVQDVTEQYVDLELRVKNARALRDRLETLLQKCDDVKSALEVERELTRVRLEIEQLEAQLRSLGQRTSFGTLEVDLQQLSEAPRTAAKLPFRWIGSLGVEHLLERGGGE